MAAHYEYQTLMNSAQYNTGVFHNVNYCDRPSLYNDRPSLIDNYGYKRGTVDYLGRFQDSAGLYTGETYNNGCLYNSYSSRIASESRLGRLNNNLGHDLGCSILHDYDSY